MGLDTDANQSLIDVDVVSTSGYDYHHQCHEYAEESSSSSRRGYVAPRKATGWINVVFILVSKI